MSQATLVDIPRTSTCIDKSPGRLAASKRTGLGQSKLNRAFEGIRARVIGLRDYVGCARTDRRLRGDNPFVGALTDLDDRAVLARVADGDSVALRELYARHAPWLGVRLRRRCADTEVVEEALQDAFVAVWKGASRFRDDGDVAAWMWGIAIRRLISRLRGRQALDVVPLQEHDDMEVAAEEVVLASIEYGDLGGALARLPPEFLLAVIEATVLDGLSTKEAAQLLGIPEGTVKTRAMRARARLRANLAGGIT